MKKIKHFLYFIILLLFAQQEMKAQCGPPGAGTNCTYNVGYYKLVRSGDTYTYYFQGGSDDFGPDLLFINEIDWSLRAILYRPVGTTDWNIRFSGVSDHDLNYLYSVAGLDACTEYEFRISCDACNHNSIIPDSYCISELCEMVEEGHMSNSFTRKTGGPAAFFEPIENIEINVLSTTEVEITWDPVPDVYHYEVQLRGLSELCVKFQTTTTNSIVLDITELSTCETCNNYALRIRSKFACPTSSSLATGYTARDTFPMGDCTARINYLRPFNYSAGVDWEVMMGDPDEFLVEWWPANDPAMITSVTVNDGPYSIPNLALYTNYEVRVTPICPSGGCIIGDTQYFTTGCNTFEPNNSFDEASWIPFNQKIATLMESNGKDYFAFVPSCDLVQVERSGNIAFSVYDSNESSMAQHIVEDNNGNAITYYQLTAGQQYFIKFSQFNTTCYEFMLKPCEDCLSLAEEIIGDDWIVLNGSSVEESYSIPVPSSMLSWSFTGPAELISNNTFLTLLYSEPGTVNITATLTNCDGTTKTFNLEVIIAGECVCGPITSIIPGAATSEPGGDFKCYRDLVAIGIDCPSTTYYWSLQYYFPDGGYKQSNVTTTENTLTVSDEGYLNECYDLTIMVAADCGPNSSSNTYSQDMQLCWNGPGCNAIEFDGEGRGEGGGLAELYPNPAKDLLTIAWQELELVAIQVYDLNGRIIMKSKVELGSKAHRLNLQGIPSGLYLVKLLDETGSFVSKKINIMH